MKIVNSLLGIKIEMKENRVQTLVAENPYDFRNIVSDLVKQLSGEDGEFIWSDKGKTLKFKNNAEIILQPFSLNFNNTKIQKALYKLFEKRAQDTFIVEKSIINSKIIEVIDQLTLDCVCEDIEFNMDFQWDKLFKLYGVKIAEDYNSMSEQIIAYIKVMSELCSINLFIFINIKDFLSPKELAEIYKEAMYLKVNIVLLESAEKYLITRYEDTFILDYDSCFIIK